MVGGVAAARLGYRPAGATCHEHRQYAPSAGLANGLYYTTLFSSKIPLSRVKTELGGFMLKRTLLCILLAGSCGLMVTAQAQQFIYKWTDEQGQPKYSELPPSAGVPYETVRKPGNTAPDTAAPGKETKDLAKEQEELSRKLAEEKAKAQEQQDQAQKEAEDARAKNCEIARRNIDVLQKDHPVVRTDAKGNKVTLDASQREIELQKAKKDQDYFCNP